MAAFKLVSEYTFWRPVSVPISHPEQSGKVVKQTLEMKFRAQSLDEMKAKMETAKDQGDAAKPMGEFEADFLAEVTLDWRGVEADDGSPIEFSQDALRQATQFPAFRDAALAAFRAGMAGEVGRKGN